MKKLIRIIIYIIAVPCNIVAAYQWAFNELTWREAWNKACKIMNTPIRF